MFKINTLIIAATSPNGRWVLTYMVLVCDAFEYRSLAWNSYEISFSHRIAMRSAWLLMLAWCPGDVVSPGHQQPCCWICHMKQHLVLHKRWCQLPAPFHCGKMIENANIFYSNKFGAARFNFNLSLLAESIAGAWAPPYNADESMAIMVTPNGLVPNPNK